MDGTGGSSTYLTYQETLTQMQPSHFRAAARQSLSLQSALMCLQSLTGTKWFPDNAKFSQSSLRRLGFRGKVLGVTPRPILNGQQQTTDFVMRYLGKLGDGGALSLDILDIPIIQCYSPPEGVEEPSAKSRCSRYAVLKARQKAAQRRRIILNLVMLR